MFGFPVKVSWPNIASLPRNFSSSSQHIPSEVSDFPISIAFSRHWGGVTPPTPPAIYVPGCKAKYSGNAWTFKAMDVTSLKFCGVSEAVLRKSFVCDLLL